MISGRQWLAAAVLALGVHAALFGLAIPSQELAMERSAGREGAVWGLPMDSIADTLEPKESEAQSAEAVEPVEPDPTRTVEAEPADPAPAETTPLDATQPERREVPEVESASADAAEAATPNSPSIEPADTVAVEAWDGGIAVAEPVAAAETATSEPAEVRTAMLTPAADADAIAARDPVPVPMERPADVPRNEAAPARAKQSAVPATPSAARHAQPRPGETQSANRANRQESAVLQPGTRSAALASAAPAGEQIGSGGTRAADGGRAVLSSYAGRVAAHLQRYKRYPDEAARQRLAGTAVVTFTLGADGRVRASKLARASGQAVFDQEVLAMVQRASPFPPIPAESGRSDYTFTVPVHFKPR